MTTRIDPADVASGVRDAVSEYLSGGDHFGNAGTLIHSAVKDAVSDWLNCATLSNRQLIAANGFGDAVERAMTAWLDEHGSELFREQQSR
jgi:hypothetical protein